MNTETTDKIPQTPEAPPVSDNSNGSGPGETSDKTTRETKRDALRAKIEASERRIAERSFSDQAKDAAVSAKDYTKQNPAIVIGGAVAIGLLIGLLSRPGRRAAQRAAIGTVGIAETATTETKHAGRLAADNTSRLGDYIGDALVALGVKLMDGAVDGARAGQDAFEDLGDSASRKARSLRRDADYFTGTTADNARHTTVRARRRANRAMRNIKGR